MTTEAPPRTFSLFVRGQPAAKGSLTAFIVGDRAIVTEKRSSSSRHWQRDVRIVLQHYWSGPPIGLLRASELKPVAVVLTFDLLKPPSAPKYRDHPTVTPDIDKLARAILDAFQGVVLVDDRQVVRLEVVKRYAPEQGVHIAVEEMT